MKSEVDLVYNLIIHPAGFGIDCGGILCIRRYEEPKWAVEWEEYHNPHDNYSKSEMEVLEFDDPYRAAECFVELRHTAEIGIDFDIIACSKLSKIDSNPPSVGYYLLGNKLEEFKNKYLK